MFPRTYCETFNRYEASDQVFVAMPFSPLFHSIFDSIIEPAIRHVTVNGKPLTARIVNRATSGSPDIHEQIFDAILHSRLVIADMTVQATCRGEDGIVRWQANANVAYEVGLAAAWRNPEDVLLIHQAHSDHRYSFDVQNLRHVQYDIGSNNAVQLLSEEIVRAINQSKFVADSAFDKLAGAMSPVALQYMYMEVKRAFPCVAYLKPSLGGITDPRIEAISELLAKGVIKNRHVVNQGEGLGIGIVFEWTELGLQLLLKHGAIDKARLQEMRSQIASVAPGQIPPRTLMDIEEVQATNAGGATSR
jgi:hypothetical protein